MITRLLLFTTVLKGPLPLEYISGWAVERFPQKCSISRINEENINVGVWRFADPPRRYSMVLINPQWHAFTNRQRLSLNIRMEVVETVQPAVAVALPKLSQSIAFQIGLDKLATGKVMEVLNGTTHLAWVTLPGQKPLVALDTCDQGTAALGDLHG